MAGSPSLRHWPSAPTLVAKRLVLEPLAADDAAELAPLLDDVGLHEFTGGRPASLDDLRTRFEIKTRGHSADGTERWLNWVVRERKTDAATGVVQATITSSPEGADAAIAWVIATSYQGRGYAKEAAAALVDWLLALDDVRLVAFIHPDHTASSSVAKSVGLRPTPERSDGEVVWVRASTSREVGQPGTPRETAAQNDQAPQTEHSGDESGGKHGA